MGAIADRREPPRPPFLERVTPSQWVLVDVLVACLLFAVALAQVHFRSAFGDSTSGSDWALWPLGAAAAFPIAVRRRWPEFALVCTGTVVLVATMFGLTFAPVIALPLYSVTLKYSRRQSLMALAIVEGAYLITLPVAIGIKSIQSGGILNGIAFAGAAWFIADSVRTRRDYQLGLVEQAKERQRQELDRAERAVAEERMEIARELHDVIAHGLSVIAIQSGVGRHVIDDQPEEAKAALSAIEEISRSALQELRRVLGVLRKRGSNPAELSPAPTLSDLDDLIQRVRSAGVPVELQFSGGTPSLPKGLELSIYRIVQEALTNVVKHAQLARSFVCIQYGQEDVVVTVRNDAIGTSAPPAGLTNEAPQASHRDRHGIVGMQERAAAFEGSLSAGPLPDGGFQVLARLPVQRVP